MRGSLSFKVIRICLLVLAIFIFREKRLYASEVIRLEQAVEIALQRNPKYLAIKEETKAASWTPSQVGALPDPQLKLGIMNIETDSFSIDQEPMTQKQIGLSQRVPFPGKLKLKQRAQESEYAGKKWSEKEFMYHLVAQVKVSWWKLYYWNKALGILERNIKQLKSFVKVAQVKYKTGKGLQQDVLLAQLELSKLLEKKIFFRNELTKQEAHLAALLDRTPNERLDLPKKVNESLSKAPDTKRLFNIGLKNRPFLEFQRKRLDASKYRLELSEMGYFPDFNFSISYGIRDGENLNGRGRSDLASAMVSISLPIYSGSKQTPRIHQRKKEHESIKYNLRLSENDVYEEIRKLHSDYESARADVELFKTGIIPQAVQTVRSMLAGYQVDKVDFLNLVTSQITLLNYETNYWKALAQAKSTFALLMVAIGKVELNEK